MTSTPPIPPRQDLGKQIWELATTLSDEMQTAAIRKTRELGFDLNKGDIPLEETLINLSHNRDIILDAFKTNKLAQLPLKLQKALYLQIHKIAETLRSLVNGTDSISILEDAVDDLTATVWQNNLHNLSDQVLGFHSKMNALKSQETLIRRAHREAEDFQAESARARELLQQIEELRKSSTDRAASVQSAADEASAVLTKLVDQEQRVAALSLQVQQHDSMGAQYVANAKTAAADVTAIADRVKTAQAEIDTAHTEFAELNGNVRQLLSTGEKTIADSVSDAQRKYEQLNSDAVTETAALRGKIDSAIQELTSSTQTKVDAALAAVQSRSTELDTSVKQLIADSENRLTQTETKHESQMTTHLITLSQKVDASLKELHDQGEAKLTELKDKADGSLAANDAQFKRLVTELDSLEGRIRESIERATGFTLFHSFQKRQLDLAKSKRFWGIALAIAVGVSLMASGYFIWSLQFVKEYNAAFFLKLSITVPLIYAIAFCNVQYSRERRLEEEYAFKSNISISLDPYQKLVGQLIDKEKPEELSKYTAFVIESVNRVFTSPTERIFGDHGDAKSVAPKTIKAVGEFIEPLLKGLKR